MGASEFDGRDFAAGVVTGVRSFRADSLARLTGIHHQQVWLPGENTSECRNANRGPRTQLEYQGAYAEYEAKMRDWQQRMHDARGPRALRPRDFLQSGGIYRDELYYYGGLESRPVEPRKPAPHSMDTCTCGFYGYYDSSDDYRTTSTVSAVVEGYGEVLIGTRGFRVTKARIVALCSLAVQQPERLHPATVRQWERIKRLYPDAAPFDDFEEMVAANPPDPSLEHSPANDPDFWTRSA